MSNNLFNSLNSTKPNFMSQLQMLKNNPAQFLLQRKFNIPEGMNNPQEIVQHLLNTGQMTQNQFNTLQQKINSFGHF